MRERVCQRRRRAPLSIRRGELLALLQVADALRAQHHGEVITYSRKVFCRSRICVGIIAGIVPFARSGPAPG